MYRIDNSTATTALPVVPPAGAPGFFTDGSLSPPVRPTIVDAWWANTVQEEIITVIGAAGLTLNKNSNGQLFEALTRLFMPVGGDGPDLTGFLPLTGGRLRGPGHDPLQIAAANGFAAGIYYESEGTRTWVAGCRADGLFGIYDASLGQARFHIDFAGHVTIVNGDLHLLRMDTPQAWIMRPDVPGFKMLNLGVQGGGPLEFFDVHATNTRLTGAVEVGGNLAAVDILAHGSVHVGGDLAVIRSTTVHGRITAGDILTGAVATTGGDANGYGVAINNASLFCSGNAAIGGSINADNITVSNAINGLNINAVQNLSGNTIYCANDIHADGAIGSLSNITAARGIYANNIATTGGDANQYGVAINNANFFCQYNAVIGAQLTVGGTVLAGGLHSNVDTWVGLDLNVVRSAAIGGSLEVSGNAAKPGDGMWSAMPFARRDVAPYERGLDAVRQLQPVSYRHDDSRVDRDQIFQGLVVEDVQDIMPEMIVKMSMKLRADDVEATEAPTINATPLTYALVNAVKELAARVEALETRR